MYDYDFNVCAIDHRIVPTRNQVTVAENDHNSDVLKIRLPRQIGLLDVLAASHILISWQSEEASGVVEIDTDYVTFEGDSHLILLWSPDNNITSYNGIITFDLTIRMVGSENVITQNWSATGGILLCLATIDAESKLYEDMISKYDEVLTAMTKGPIIRDNYWYTYNWDKKMYQSTGVAASGNPGPSGPAGEKGERGEPGEIGPAGQDGKTPIKGVDYWTEDDKAEILSASTKPPVIKNGNWYVYDVETKDYVDTLTAATGPAGQDGQPGERGPAGEQGERGERGERGETGETGPAGADGKTPERGVDYWTENDKNEILSESTKPPLIKNGNWYTYDTTTKEYVDTEVSATGPAGQPGERGPAGETGPAGERGERGETGPAGQNGQDGKTPIRGTDYWTAEDQSAIITEILTHFIDAEAKSY